MRAPVTAALLGLVVAGCDPEFASHAYLCGANESCPPDYVCDPSDGACVLPEESSVFACVQSGDAIETLREPDDTIDTAAALAPVCSALPVVLDGCIAGADDEDWLQVDIPSGCDGDRELIVHTTYFTGFAPVAIRLTRRTVGVPDATEHDCASPTAIGGQSDRCADVAVHAGERWFVELSPAGYDNCRGDCAFNHYQVEVSVARP